MKYKCMGWKKKRKDQKANIYGTDNSSKKVFTFLISYKTYVLKIGAT